MDCLFCKIINKQIPADFVFENDKVVVFRDISPQAPFHVLVVPKQHLQSVMDWNREDDADIWLNVLEAIQTVASCHGLDQNGFRVVTNIGDWGGQTVHHVHFHILGGRALEWPPG